VATAGDGSVTRQLLDPKETPMSTSNAEPARRFDPAQALADATAELETANRELEEARTARDAANDVVNTKRAYRDEVERSVNALTPKTRKPRRPRDTGDQPAIEAQPVTLTTTSTDQED